MYNFIGIWVRIMGYILLVMCMVIIMMINWKRLKKKEKWFYIIVVLLFSGISMGDSVEAIINPEISQIEGVFQSEMANHELSFFESEYCFQEENQKYYISMDAISKKIIYPAELKRGKNYTVFYEKKENVIIQIIEKE